MKKKAYRIRDTRKYLGEVENQVVYVNIYSDQISYHCGSFLEDYKKLGLFNCELLEEIPYEDFIQILKEKGAY